MDQEQLSHERSDNPSQCALSRHEKQDWLSFTIHLNYHRAKREEGANEYQCPIGKSQCRLIQSWWTPLLDTPIFALLRTKIDWFLGDQQTHLASNKMQNLVVKCLEKGVPAESAYKKS